MVEHGFPRPCEVLVGQEWLPATLHGWYRWPDGSWRGSVTFTRRLRVDQLNPPYASDGRVFPFQFEQSRPAHELRAVTPPA